MKNLFRKLLLLTVTAIMLVGCATLFGERAGTLPKNWWTKDIGEVENYYKEKAAGIEQAVKIFIAQNDSALNIDRSTAIENARIDAAVQLSRYLSQKVTNVRQMSTHISAGNVSGENHYNSNKYLLKLNGAKNVEKCN